MSSSNMSLTLEDKSPNHTSFVTTSITQNLRNSDNNLTSPATSSPYQPIYPSYIPSMSLLPSVSSIPTLPTSYPTSSIIPTINTFPSESPSVSSENVPSTPPTLFNGTSYSKLYLQRFLVSTTEGFSQEQMNIFQYIYERYTANFGYNISTPQIQTACTITQQSIAIAPSENKKRSGFNRYGRKKYQSDWSDEIELFNNRRQLQMYRLSMWFDMQYTTRLSQYNISNYNLLFQSYVNSNLTKVASDMAMIGLPVESAGEALMFTSRLISPTIAPTTEPTWSISRHPTSLPSFYPSLLTSPPIIVDVSGNSFVLGISLGLSGAFLIAAVGFFYIRHKEKSQKNSIPKTSLVTNMHEVNDNDNMSPSDDEQLTLVIEPLSMDQCAIPETQITDPIEPIISKIHEQPSISLPVTDENSLSIVETIEPISHLHDEGKENLYSTVSPRESSLVTSYSHFLALPFEGDEERLESLLVSPDLTSEMFPGANNNALLYNASFSSENEEEETSMIIMSDSFNNCFNPSALDGSADELDNYKNQNLEMFRSAVEETIDNVDGMLMLAVTHALTESEMIRTDFSWIEGLDHGSIEASILWETFDWLKRSEKTMVDSRNEYLQSLLNRMVKIVLNGFVLPLEGAQIVHSCVTILGLPLLKQLPSTTLIIQGMRKTNDLVQGQQFIRKAFKSFGEVVVAAIAPNNRGFGFIRFAQEHSVKLALEKYRMYEIEIQDVSVSVKILKSENTL